MQSRLHGGPPVSSIHTVSSDLPPWNDSKTPWRPISLILSIRDCRDYWKETIHGLHTAMASRSCLQTKTQSSLRLPSSLSGLEKFSSEEISPLHRKQGQQSPTPPPHPAYEPGSAERSLSKACVLAAYLKIQPKILRIDIDRG